MTDEEKKAQMTQRNDAICAYYLAGHKLSECSSHFKLGKQRVLQILQKAGVWKPYVKRSDKHGRTKFLGVTISEETGNALKQRAVDEGVSVSKLTSDALDALVEVK